MSAAWRDHAGAPPAGFALCEAAAVPDGTARCLVVTSEAGRFPLLLVRIGGQLRAYVNACPHQYLPLDYRSNQVLTADGRRLLCSAHQASFDAITGRCVSGEAADGLEPVPVIEDNGCIAIAPDQPEDAPLRSAS